MYPVLTFAAAGEPNDSNPKCANAWGFRLYGLALACLASPQCIDRRHVWLAESSQHGAVVVLYWFGGGDQGYGGRHRRPNFFGSKLKFMKSLIFWKWSFWLLVLITLWLSLIPADQVPPAFHFWDKAQHALGFMGLGFLGLIAYPGRVQAVMFGLVLLGVGIEVAQWFTGWRNGDWQDWVADCLGMMIGAVAWRLRRLRPRT